MNIVNLPLLPSYQTPIFKTCSGGQTDIRETFSENEEYAGLKFEEAKYSNLLKMHPQGPRGS